MDITLVSDLEGLIEPVTRGDPESPLRWSCKSLRTLANELEKMGHKASHTHVGKLLVSHGYSLQGNKKTLEGSGHPDRNAQFEYINAKVTDRLINAEPVISVDTKKKELIGRFKNNGRTWRPKGEPTEVKVHDFIEESGRANPYGVCDIGADEGWVSVGTDHNTAAFAVQTIRRWWFVIGSHVYPKAQDLLITYNGYYYFFLKKSNKLPITYLIFCFSHSIDELFQFHQQHRTFDAIGYQFSVD